MNEDSLSKIKKELSSLKKLKIASECTQPVFGDGNTNSKIVFIGEAPGKEEDKTGKPFVGRSGKLLDQLLESINLKRSDIYITNIVKFRPPENRDPTNEEKQVCGEFLKRELAIIKPKVIVTLGRHSMNFFEPNLKISESHGEKYTLNLEWGNQVILYPLYHPAVALYNPSKKQILFEDFKYLSHIL